MLEAAGLVVAVVQFVAEVGRAGERWWGASVTREGLRDGAGVRLMPLERAAGGGGQSSRSPGTLPPLGAAAVQTPLPAVQLAGGGGGGGGESDFRTMSVTAAKYQVSPVRHLHSDASLCFGGEMQTRPVD